MKIAVEIANNNVMMFSPFFCVSLFDDLIISYLTGKVNPLHEEKNAQKKSQKQKTLCAM